MSALDVAGWIGIGLAVVMQWGFVAYYAPGPWWKDFVGRAIMAKSAIIAVVLTSTIVHAIVPPYAAEQAVRVGLMWAITITIGYQLHAIRKQRRLDRAGTTSHTVRR